MTWIYHLDTTPKLDLSNCLFHENSGMFHLHDEFFFSSPSYLCHIITTPPISLLPSPHLLPSVYLCPLGIFPLPFSVSSSFCSPLSICPHDHCSVVLPLLLLCIFCFALPPSYLHFKIKLTIHYFIHWNRFGGIRGAVLGQGLREIEGFRSEIQDKIWNGCIQ